MAPRPPPNNASQLEGQFPAGGGGIDEALQINPCAYVAPTLVSPTLDSEDDHEKINVTLGMRTCWAPHGGGSMTELCADTKS